MLTVDDRTAKVADGATDAVHLLSQVPKKGVGARHSNGSGSRIGSGRLVGTIHDIGEAIAA